jgi:hypothetical protein
MSTHLFPGKWRRADRLAAAAIETPLGTVHLGGEISGKLLNADQANSYTSHHGARLLVWNTPVMAVELMLCKLPRDVNDEYDKKLMGYHAGLWRVRAEKQPFAGYVLTCGFQATAACEGGSSSGEWLAALQWDDGVINVTVGLKMGQLFS